MNPPTRILLVDDHSLFRESLVRLLEAQTDLRVVAHCAGIAEALNILDRNPIDVILLDYDLGEERGTELLRQLEARDLRAKVLMVTAGMSESVTRDALQAGVDGVLYKHNSPDQLLEAIRKVAGGEMWLEGQIIRSLVVESEERAAESRGTRPLTERQLEVLSGILEGLTNKEIAWNLKVSESSVKAVIQELFHKAGVRTRSQLVRIAIEKHAGDWISHRRGAVGR
jgi:two-component system, NarL family, nitrate/nitrite response regulator NarL